MYSLFSSHLSLVLTGVILLGGIAGILGVFVLVRQQSLLPDAISHASFAGVSSILLLTGSSHPFVLFCGGSIAGIISTFFVLFVTSKTTIKRDAILGITLSVFFGLGLVLMSIIQRKALAQKSLLQHFLFGNAAALLPNDIYNIFILGGIILFILALFWKEFKILSFDSEYMQSLGYSTLYTDFILTGLLIITIVMGLQITGVLLMSSLLLAPVAAARQWTSNFFYLGCLSSFVGAVGCFLGVLISDYVHNIPTGPVIVVLLSFFVFISLFFAPHRGLLFRNG